MTSITLISGSTLGSAEYTAEFLAEKLNDGGYVTTVLHGPTLAELPLTGLWLIVSSTHGAGDLPSNLQPLFDQLEQTESLSKICYGAIGIGNSEYDLFCGAIDKLDTLLTKKGAIRLGTVLKIDVLQHDLPEDAAELWLEAWQQCIAPA